MVEVSWRYRNILVDAADRITRLGKKRPSAAEFVLKHQPLAYIKMGELYDEHTPFPAICRKEPGQLRSNRIINGRSLAWAVKVTKGRTPTDLEFLDTCAIPGTSTEVERLFSLIKDVWGTQEGHLDLKTLEAHLEIKFNCKKSCSEFFDAVKSNKKLLSQVQL